MAKSAKEILVAGLDIGTTKAVCAVAAVRSDQIEVIGVGKASHSGVKHGAVVNIEATAAAIKKAKDEAELMSGHKFSQVWLGIAGAHIQSFDSQGMVAVANREVTAEDVERVIEAAKAVAIPTDRQVLHVISSDFRIDGQDGINDPIGMAGIRLESSVHIVTGSFSAIQNAIRCTERAGLTVRGMSLQQLASADSVLSPDEKHLGVALVDMGGGTCDIVVYLQNSVVFTGCVPVGGNNFTHDLAMGLRTTQVEAEALKRKMGVVPAARVPEDERVEVAGVGGRPQRTLPRRELAHILEARAEETLALIRGELTDSGFLRSLGSGVVLTGGASQLNGIEELGDYLFDVPVRKGAPHSVGGLTDIVRCPEYATVVGLMLHGAKEERIKLMSELPDESFGEVVSGWAKRVRELLS